FRGRRQFPGARERAGGAPGRLDQATGLELAQPLLEFFDGRERIRIALPILRHAGLDAPVQRLLNRQHLVGIVLAASADPGSEPEGPLALWGLVLLHLLIIVVPKPGSVCRGLLIIGLLKPSCVFRGLILLHLLLIIVVLKPGSVFRLRVFLW